MPNSPEGAPERRPRFILAAVYGHPDIESTYSHAIIEITKCDVDVVQLAMRAAADFDKSLEGAFTGSTLTSGSMYGEYVFERLPEEIEEWLNEQEDWSDDLPRLLPRELDETVERIIDEEWRSNDNRWASNTVRWKCSATEVRGEIEDKHACDIYLWTRDLWPIFKALVADPEAPGFAIPNPT